MSQTGKITLILFSVIVSLFVLSTAVAQESTEAEMSDDMDSDMSSDTAAEEEVIELEEAGRDWFESATAFCYRFSGAD